MRKSINIVLAAAAVCVMSARASAQTYGGASSGDLLGYRSSSAHYYNRGMAKKVRRQSSPPAAGRGGATAAKVPRNFPLVGTTTFKPVAEMVAPARLAALAPAGERAGVEKYYREVLADYRTILREKGLAGNDVARAAAYAVIVSHDVYYEGRSDLSPEQAEGVRAMMRRVFSTDPEFQRKSDGERQELFESYGIIGLHTISIYDAAARAGRRDIVEKMRRGARVQLEETFGVPPEKLEFTAEGVRYR